MTDKDCKDEITLCASTEIFPDFEYQLNVLALLSKVYPLLKSLPNLGRHEIRNLFYLYDFGYIDFGSGNSPETIINKYINIDNPKYDFNITAKITVSGIDLVNGQGIIGYAVDKQQGKDHFTENAGMIDPCQVSETS